MYKRKENMDFFIDSNDIDCNIDFSNVYNLFFNGTMAGGLTLDGMQIKTPFKAIPFSSEKWWGSISEKHTDGDQLHVELFFIPLDGDLKYSLCSLIVKGYSLRNLSNCLVVARNNVAPEELALEIDVVTVSGKRITKQVKFNYSKIESDHQWLIEEVKKARKAFSEGKLILKSSANTEYLTPYKEYLALQEAK